jgi:protein-S-isoprenylcysteine O-methyltransferase Ste14
MRSDIAALPLLVGFNAIVLAAQAVAWGGIESLARGMVPAALAILSLGMVLEIVTQRGDRVLTMPCGFEGWAATLLNSIQGVCLLAGLQLALAMGGAQMPGGACIASGMGVLVGGFLLRLTAIRALGPAFGDGFSPVSGDRIAQGPYRFCRHPAEAGLLLLPIGTAALVGAGNTLPFVMPPLVLCSMARILAEEMSFRREYSGRPSRGNPLAGPGGH